ncbi:fasciclin domain-containing protein [Chitinophaga pendula]|uniref:fasciclin domain-containing protein n=1 Tax=Chitinophaga TaxID=79328 RepID=UPI000BB0589E|nr:MULTISPECIES: fasciclin domain-containing protein [Chitinophaga]ASZ11120.1 hypothetical protein CK934_09170 [Chitinophaga sp. MD30]UCJ05883.1 fasciclin domain-containing protein [Chitinophaga pendula]
MNTNTKHIYQLAGVCIITMIFAGCSIFGLDLQKNDKHDTSTLDPHIYKPALQYLRERATGPVKNDSIFNLMWQAIKYAELDTNEYAKTGRTFLFLHNDAILRISNNKPTTDCYFGRYPVNNKPATKWEDYPKQQVKNFLLYLIAQGEYSFNNVQGNNVETKTLLPEGADPLNPKSLIYFRAVNDRNSKFRINDFPGTARVTEVRTSNILSTNGPIHVVDRVVEYGVK